MAENSSSESESSLPGVILPASEDCHGDFVLGVTELMVACYKGELEKVGQILMKDSRSVHRTNCHGVTALDYAVDAKKLKVIDVLLGYGVDIDGLDRDGRNILHRSVMSNQMDKVRTCLELGVNINVPTKDGDTALILAVKHQFIDILVCLLKMDCDIMPINRDGLSAIDCAFINGYTNIRYLIEEILKYKEIDRALGAIMINECVNGNVTAIESMLSLYGDTIVHFKDSRNSNVTPLIMACRHGHLSAARVLLSHRAIIHAADLHGNTPLHHAAIFDKGHILKWLIDNGALINSKNCLSRSALHCAVIEDHLDIVKILVENGIFLNVRSENGASALHFAVEKDFEEIVRYLIGVLSDLDQGELINIRDEGGATPLARAAMGDRQRCALALLDFGAHIDDRCTDDLAPLTLAAHLGFLPVVKMLIQSGASISFAMYNGKSVLDIALNNGSFDVYAYLMQCTTALQDQCWKRGNILDSTQQKNYYNKELISICDQGLLPVTSLAKLLHNGADVNTRDQNGLTPLFLSVKKLNLVYVSWLLKHHADVDAQDDAGVTPLMCAVEMGHLHMVEFLIRKQANTLIRDKKCRDILQIAEESEQNDILTFLKKLKSVPLSNSGEREFYSAVVDCEKVTCQKLLRGGVNINCVDSHGRNALAWCLENTSPQSLELIGFLCSCGIDINHKDCKGYSLIEQSVTAGNIQITRELLKHGVQIDDLLPGIIIDAWLSSEKGMLSAVEHNASSKNTHEYYDVLLKFSVANVAGDFTKLCTENHSCLEKFQFSFFTVCDEQVICRVAEQVRESAIDRDHIKDIRHAVLKTGLERNLPEVLGILFHGSVQSQSRHLADKDMPLKLALDKGNYEVAAMMTTSALIVSDRTSAESSQHSEKAHTLENTLHHMNSIWMDTLDTVYKVVISKIHRFPSQSIIGVSRHITKPTLYLHTRNKANDSFRTIHHFLANIPHWQIYQLEFIKQRDLATRLNGPCSNTSGSYWMKLKGLKKSKLDEECFNVQCASVGCFLEHCDFIWAITGGSSFHLEGVFKGYGKLHCNFSLGVISDGKQEIVFSANDTCIFYAKNCIWDSTKTVNVVAVPIKSKKNLSFPLYKKQDVFDGADEVMLGRKVTISGLSSGLTEGVVMEVNASFKDDAGVLYHGIFVIFPMNLDQQFILDGNNSATVTDIDSGLILGLVYGAYKNYVLPKEHTRYDCVLLALRLNYQLRFMHDKLNMKLGKLRTFSVS